MRRGSAIHRLGVVASGLALVAGACSGDGRPQDIEPGFIVWTEPVHEGLDALVGGTVDIRADGCVMLTSDGGSVESAVIWPYKTTFDGEVIRTKDGIEIRDGDRVRSSGGEVVISVGDNPYYLDSTSLSVDLELVRDCVGQENFRIIAFNPLPPIEVMERGSQS